MQVVKSSSADDEAVWDSVVTPAEGCQVAADDDVAVGTYPVDGVPVTVMPPIDVALTVPVPDVAIVAPEPTVIVAVVLVPLVMAENAVPPPEIPQAPPAS